MSDAERNAAYRADLARVHHEGFGFLAEGCAAGIVARLAGVRGVVLELGCGSGILTRHLVAAGHRVIASDASEAMLELAREHAPGAEYRRLVLPDAPLPRAAAVVSVGHVLSYLADEAAIEHALVRIAEALEPGGVLVIDLCDLRFGELRGASPPSARVTDDWAIFVRASKPAPNRLVRDITTFVRTDDGTWRRDDERHENVLVDTAKLPALLARHGVAAELMTSFGDAALLDGLVALVGRRVR